ncbi:MAG: hypothetical protein R3B70_14485 [Polyangiaceae bacterium]
MASLVPRAGRSDLLGAERLADVLVERVDTDGGAADTEASAVVDIGGEDAGAAEPRAVR